MEAAEKEVAEKKNEEVEEKKKEGAEEEEEKKEGGEEEKKKEGDGEEEEKKEGGEKEKKKEGGEEEEEKEGDEEEEEKKKKEGVCQIRVVHIESEAEREVRLLAWRSKQYEDPVDEGVNAAQDTIDLTGGKKTTTLLVNAKRNNKFFEESNARLAKGRSCKCFSSATEAMIYVTKSNLVAIFDGVYPGFSEPGNDVVQQFARGLICWDMQKVGEKNEYMKIKANDKYSIINNKGLINTDMLVVGFSAHKESKSSYMVHFWSESKGEFLRASGVNFMKHLLCKQSQLRQDKSNVSRNDYSIRANPDILNY